MPRHKRQRPKKRTPGSGAPGTHGRRQRWFYDVRQYGLITDKDGKLLILQLPADYDDAAANTWTLPGGKLEPADDPAAGILREIKEETGLVPTMNGPCTVARWSTRNSKKLAIFYTCSVPTKQPEPKLSREHQRSLWVSLADINEFPFHRPDMVTVIKQQLKK
ncbi:MAG TPA: NUDIX hydrolase [Alphaproteobacteria bacterium]|nr:NUDIX hydrolase [Alphaproteobacteria bacterium]